MKRVFVSSIQRDYTDVRAAARAAVESLGMLPVMAETTPAAAGSPRDTLLSLVQGCDAVLLLIGPRYGEPGESGFSPTEDEFRAAVQAGIPVLPLIQEGEREPRQDEFVSRIRGTWEQGYYAPTFRDAADAGLKAVAALRAHFEQEQTAEARPAAEERLQELAGVRNRHAGQGTIARLTVVTVGAPLLLDAMALDRPELADDIASLLRTHRIATQAMGLQAAVSRAGVTVTGKEESSWDGIAVLVGSRGEVTVEADVGGEGMLGGLQIADERVRQLAQRGLAFAAAALDRIDGSRLARQLLAALSVPDAESKLYITAPHGSSSRVPMGVPSPLIAPAVHVRREDLAAAKTGEALVAGLRREFADHGALDR
jgi:hypothetical protein